MTTRFLDLYVLQALPYNNLNRDDLGNPKTSFYGGVQRTRISSQCTKRAVREHMQQVLEAAGLPGYDPATRTPRAVERLTAWITDRHSDWSATDAHKAAEVIFFPYLRNETPAKVKAATAAEDEEGTYTAPEDEEEAEARRSVMLFLTDSQYDDLTDLAADHKAELLAATPKKEGTKVKEASTFKPLRKAIEDILREPRGLIALFGRMIASLPTANVDAGVRLNHPETVHEGVTEADYFAAVDDYPQEGSRGAGHLGEAAFSSGVFYRYATIDLGQMAKNIPSRDIREPLIRQFIESFIRAVPKGKQNGTAAYTPVNLVAIAARSDQPISYAAAFERPVRETGDGYLLPALSALATHATLIRDTLGYTPLWQGHTNAAAPSDAPISADLNKALGDHLSLADLIDAAMASI